jgi:hypothetical protein
MKTQKLFVSIALTFVVGCFHDVRGKHKVQKKSHQPVSESARKEELPKEGESVTKMDSGAEYRGPANPETTNPPVIKLRSGKEVKVRAAGKIYFTEAKPGWMFQYETTLKIDDVPALQEEAEEIWSLLEKEVEKGGYDSAILSANETPKKTSPGPFSLSNNRGYNFVFEKDESGKWTLTDKKTKDKSKKPKSP